MSSEKRGPPPDQYNQPAPGYQSPPPGYQPAPQYPPPPGMHGGQNQYYTDHPHFPPGGIQANVIVAPGPMSMNEPPPQDYMGRAIFVTLCCFWPVGIFAIMKASEARSAYARGDMAGARTASASARQLTNISIIAGVASIIVSMIIVGVYLGLIMTNLRT